MLQWAHLTIDCTTAFSSARLTRRPKSIRRMARSSTPMPIPIMSILRRCPMVDDKPNYGVVTVSVSLNRRRGTAKLKFSYLFF